MKIIYESTTGYIKAICRPTQNVEAVKSNYVNVEVLDAEITTIDKDQIGLYWVNPNTLTFEQRP
jgi:hypothetical protein